MRKIKGETDNETQVKITRQLNGRKIEQDVNQREDKILQDDQSKTGDAKATDHEREISTVFPPDLQLLAIMVKT